VKAAAQSSICPIQIWKALVLDSPPGKGLMHFVRELSFSMFKII
jgi:hypothetical protein